jgi:Xaa-Pro aminopeptidase
MEADSDNGMVTAETRARELQRRRSELGSDLRERGAGALIATREGVVTYMTGYTTRTWSNFSRPVIAVLFADESLALICAETEADAVRERVSEATVHPYVTLSPIDESLPLPDGRVQFAPEAAECLHRLIAELPDDVVAVDGLRAAFPPVAQITSLVPGLEQGAIDASRFVWDRRLRKSAWEVQQLKWASAVLERAFEAFEPRLRPGQSEREIHGMLAAACFEQGADELGYTNVVAGTNRGLFGAPTDRTWRRDEVLYVDGGVVVDGYWADFCRMYSAGRPSASQGEGYELARRGLDQALGSFRQGITAADLSRAIQEATDLSPGNVGFGRFGHGIGLYMPEPPSIHVLDETPLTDGMVICVEPAVLHEGSNYVVEEEHVVRDGQLVRISPAAPEGIVEV